MPESEAESEPIDVLNGCSKLVRARVRLTRMQIKKETSTRKRKQHSELRDENSALDNPKKTSSVGKRDDELPAKETSIRHVSEDIIDNVSLQEQDQDSDDACEERLKMKNKNRQHSREKQVPQEKRNDHSRSTRSRPRIEKAVHVAETSNKTSNKGNIEQFYFTVMQRG